MDNLELNSEFYQNRNLKSFIRVGVSFIDIKQTIGFSFIKDPDGYIIIQFVYDSGRAMNAFLKDRQEFSLFLLELDPFIDDVNALSSMTDFINEIEMELRITNGYPKPKKTRKRKNNKNSESE